MSGTNTSEQVAPPGPGFFSRLKLDALDIAKIIIGAMIIAAGVNIFLIPNKVVTGGITGIGILINHFVGTPTGTTIFLLNLPVLYLGYKYGGGKTFIFRTLVGVFAFTASIDIMAPFLPAYQGDRLLIIVYGGLMDGLGLAIIFHGRGTTGGIDVIGRLINRKYDIAVGQTMLVCNLLVYLIAGITFGAEPVMIAFLLAFVSARTLDTALQGFSAARSAWIISRNHEEVKDAVIRHLGRGVTVLSGEGGFSGEPRPVLYVVVARHEVSRLKQRVMEQDPDAFVAVMPAQQISGGFNIPRPRD